MNQAVLINLAIILFSSLALLYTKNPLAMLGLMFLLPLPYNVHPSVLAHQEVLIESENDDDDESKPIGFNAPIR